MDDDSDSKPRLLVVKGTFEQFGGAERDLLNNLLCVGSEEPRKRIDFLVEVLGSLPSHLKDTVILHKVGAESSQKSKSKLSKRAKEINIYSLARFA